MSLIHTSAPDYYGTPAQSLENRYLRVVYLSGAGPRIVGLYLRTSPGRGESDNFLAELPGLGWETPFGRFHLRGGHRLWVAPEQFPQTSIPDNQPVAIELFPQGVCLVQECQVQNDLQKSIQIELEDARPAIRLTHRLLNCGQQPIRLAPWAITQLPPGGVALLPHGDRPENGPELLPDRNLVLWPYTRLQDPRLRLDANPWQINADGQGPKLKIGYLNDCGWAAYIRRGMIFCKRFTPLNPDTLLPDRGCNVEVFTDAQMLELETLGPLQELAPGQSIEHQETWECYAALDDPFMGLELRAALEAIA